MPPALIYGLEHYIIYGILITHTMKRRGEGDVKGQGSSQNEVNKDNSEDDIYDVANKLNVNSVD
jgi:hypothetical protein